VPGDVMRNMATFEQAGVSDRTAGKPAH
jgi:hypothetical protein